MDSTGLVRCMRVKPSKSGMRKAAQITITLPKQMVLYMLENGMRFTEVSIPSGLIMELTEKDTRESRQ